MNVVVDEVDTSSLPLERDTIAFQMLILKVKKRLPSRLEKSGIISSEATTKFQRLVKREQKIRQTQEVFVQHMP